MVHEGVAGEGALAAAGQDRGAEQRVLAEGAARLRMQYWIVLVEPADGVERVASVGDVACLEERRRPVHRDRVVERTHGVFARRIGIDAALRYDHVGVVEAATSAPARWGRAGSRRR